MSSGGPSILLLRTSTSGHAGMFSSMNGKSSSPAFRPRATRSTWTLSANGSCRRIRTSIGITSISPFSSTSHPSMTTSRLPIDAGSAAVTNSSRRSLSTRLRAL